MLSRIFRTASVQRLRRRLDFPESNVAIIHTLQSRSYSRIQHYPEKWMYEYDGWEYWTEDLSKYESGVYYAVHLGDRFGDGRYRVLHKLGNGVFSQVWLAQDQHSRGHGFVALKIVPAGTTEARILRYLAQQSPWQNNPPGLRHVVKLLDHVPVQTTRGSYDCLVLEVVGSDLFSLLKKTGRGLHSDSARQASVQIARALAYMHDLKICHGDLYSKNICYTLDGIKDDTENKVMSLLGSPYILPIRRRNGRPLHPSLPKYTVKPEPFQRAKGELKVVDFGEAFHFEDKPAQVSTPNILKAPELLIFPDQDNQWDHRIDLWALGCFIWEVFIGQPLFHHMSPEGLLWEMTRMLGELPPDWQRRVDFDKYSDSGNPPLRLEEQLRIDYNEHSGRGGMTSEDLDQLVSSVLRNLLVLDPARRVSAEETATHPWLTKPNM